MSSYGDYIQVPSDMTEKEFPLIVKRMFRHLNDLRKCGAVEGNVSLTVKSSAVPNIDGRVNIAYEIEDGQQSFFEEE